MTRPANQWSWRDNPGASDDDEHSVLPAGEPAVGRCLECSAWVPPNELAFLECGHEIAEHNRLRLSLGFVGTILTLTVVLAPVGLPMLWLAYRHCRRAEGSVTPAAETLFRDHILAVMRQHLGLRASMEGGSNFNRGDTRGARELGQPPEL